MYQTQIVARMRCACITKPVIYIVAGVWKVIKRLTTNVKDRAVHTNVTNMPVVYKEKEIIMHVVVITDTRVMVLHIVNG